MLLGAVTGSRLAGLRHRHPRCSPGAQPAIAEPYLLGVSSWHRSARVSVIVFGVTLFGRSHLSVVPPSWAPWARSLLACDATARTGDASPSSRLVSVRGGDRGGARTAVLDLLLHVATTAQRARAVLAWTLGGLAGQLGTLWLPSTALLLGVGVLMRRPRNLNLLLVRGGGATTMGLDVARFLRARCSCCSPSSTACWSRRRADRLRRHDDAHIVRLFVGGDHRRVLPTAALGGAVFLVWSDIAARTIAAPIGDPVASSRPCCGGRSSCG
ncbi:hypothetical protein GCM10023238_09050 [Streptomyces heliomycini]